MAGLGAIAISTAPILGEALLAGAAGQLKGPDYRSGINQDLDLLQGVTGGHIGTGIEVKENSNDKHARAGNRRDRQGRRRSRRPAIAKGRGDSGLGASQRCAQRPVACDGG